MVFSENDAVGTAIIKIAINVKIFFFIYSSFFATEDTEKNLTLCIRFRVHPWSAFLYSFTTFLTMLSLENKLILPEIKINCNSAGNALLFLFYGIIYLMELFT